MSSILKALKKVEDVHPEPRQTETWSHAFDSREAIRKRARRSHAARTGMAALCAALVLGVGGWLLYGEVLRPGGGPERPPEAVATGTPAAGTAASPSPPQQAPARPSAPEPRDAAPQPVVSAAAPAVRPSPPPGSAAAVPSPRSREAPRPVSSEPPPSAGAGAQEAAEPLDTSRFRLEAIVWSSNPESRFAVINGSILRLGGTLDGLTVTDIERNSVMLRSGSRAGEVRFDRD